MHLGGSGFSIWGSEMSVMGSLKASFVLAGLKSAIRPDKTQSSAVTTAWGVDWDEEAIARDIMQNFFDANRHSIDEVSIRNVGDLVIVHGPASLDLERLFYLGSEKGSDDIGHYGEGFKVAATCLLRDHNVTPISVSGTKAVLIRVSESTVGDTDIRPIEYSFFRLASPVEGTFLLLPNCSRKLIGAMKDGLSHFFHPGNKRIGKLLWSSRKEDLQIFESTKGNGCVFYRNLKRGQITGIPIVLVLNKELAAIEKKTGKDRDRNAFGDELMRLFFAQFAKGIRFDEAAQKIILKASATCWQQGHALLSEFASVIGQNLSFAVLTEVFSQNKYFATQSKMGLSGAEILQVDNIESSWERSGLARLPGYFSRFGVVNAKRQIEITQLATTQDRKDRYLRQPSDAETLAIRLLTKVLEELEPEIAAMFRKRRVTYTIGMCDTLLGELRDTRRFYDIEVLLAESFFIGEFGFAVSVFLHEHTHIFGHDGSRGFTDALTRLLETVLRLRSKIGRYEKQWDSVRARINEERKNQKSIGRTDSIEEWISALDKGTLRTIVRRVPTGILNSIRSANGVSD
jgi:hypothetical protein